MSAFFYSNRQWERDSKLGDNRARFVSEIVGLEIPYSGSEVQSPREKEASEKSWHDSPGEQSPEVSL